MNWANLTVLLVTAYVAVFVQSWFQGVRALVGAPLDLLPALVVCAALRGHIVEVALLATVGGLWVDALSANPFGISVLPLAVPGFVLHATRGLVVHTDPGIRFLLGLGASAAAPLLTLLLLVACDARPLLDAWFPWRWLAGSVLGASFTPLFFRLLEWIARALNYQPETATPFRADREIERGRDPHADY